MLHVCIVFVLIYSGEKNSVEFLVVFVVFVVVVVVLLCE